MSSQGKPQLTDRAGNPIGPRYIDAFEKIRSKLWRRYPQIRDESDQDDVTQNTLCKVIDFETKFGTAGNLLALIEKSFRWAAGSLLRQSYYRLDPVSMPEWSGDIRSTAQTSGLEERLVVQQCLAQLSDRERKIILLLARGFKPTHVAIQLDITTANVYQIAHRARTKLLAAGISNPTPIKNRENKVR
jgi:RNA polymerase sigma factor (sigma-70 family)